MRGVNVTPVAQIWIGQVQFPVHEIPARPIATVLPFRVSPTAAHPPVVLASEGRLNGDATQAQYSVTFRAERFMRPGSDEDYTSNSSTLSAVGSVPSVT